MEIENTEDDRLALPKVKKGCENKKVTRRQREKERHTETGFPAGQEERAGNTRARKGTLGALGHSSLSLALCRSLYLSSFLLLFLSLSLTLFLFLSFSLFLSHPISLFRSLLHHLLRFLLLYHSLLHLKNFSYSRIFDWISS